MSELPPPTASQRFLPHDRESFFEAQRRNRHATWRISALCVIATVVMGIPLTLIVTPLLYAITLAVADVINAVSPLPAAIWTEANEVARWGFAAVGTLTGQQKSDPQTALLGAALLVVPGAVLSVGLWLGMSLLFRRAGVGGALLALRAREPDRSVLEELRLVNVVEEMAIAAGLPVPRVMLIEAPGANAAAIGTSPTDARIIVSRPLIANLSREELEGALAHVVASIGNGDLRIAFRVTAVFETCGLLVAMLNAPFGRQSRVALWRIVRYGLLGSSQADGSTEAAALAAILTRNLVSGADDIDRFFDSTPKKSMLRSVRNFLFFPIFFTNAAIKLSLWFFSFAVLGPSVALLWRTRRYLADASAVQLTRNPDGLAGALQKLSDDGGAIPGGDWAAPLFVVSPKASDRGVQNQPTPQQKEMLARAWIAAGQNAGASSEGSASDFAALLGEAAATYRAALAGDVKASARIAALKQFLTASDPALAARIPDPADVGAAFHGDPAAIKRLRAFRGQGPSEGLIGAPAQSGDDGSAGIAAISFLGFHPSLKRRLKRLDRMGAHASVAAADRKLAIVAAVLGLVFAPLVLLLIGLFLLLIAIMTMASLTFLAVWLAFIHSMFGLFARGAG